MNNLETLIAAGVVPENHGLTAEEISVIASMSEDEVDALTQNGVRFGKEVHKGAPTFHVAF